LFYNILIRLSLSLSFFPTLPGKKEVKKKAATKKKLATKKKPSTKKKEAKVKPAKSIETLEEQTQNIRTYAEAIRTKAMAKFEATCNKDKGDKTVQVLVPPPPQPNLRKATRNEDDNNTVMTHAEEYNPYKPYVYGLDYYKQQLVVDNDDENDTSNDCPSYEPLPLHGRDRHQPKFVLPNGIDGSAESLSYYGLPDSFVDEIVINTNKYAIARLGKGKFIPAKKHEILGFFAIHYYMGIVKLPAKRDYWTTDPNWPSHPFNSFQAISVLARIFY
jgi:hypothetical protein